MSKTDIDEKKIFQFLRGLTVAERKYLEGCINISAAFNQLLDTTTEDEFFKKIGHEKLSPAKRKDFLSGAYDYHIKDIAACEAWRCGIFLRKYTDQADALAQEHAKILHVVRADASK